MAMPVGSTLVFANIGKLAERLNAETFQMWENAGKHFTCPETNALVELLRAVGCDDHAQALLESHALHDEDGDDPAHVGMTYTLMYSNEDHTPPDDDE